MLANRFGNIIQGCPSAPLYDLVLWDLGEIVVAPTLGSIVPDWLLAVPRQGSLNVVRWMAGNPAKPLEYIAKIAEKASRAPDDVLWFEHGPSSIGHVTGCGVDHAHIHVLLEPGFSFETFGEAAKKSTLLHWKEGSGNPYRLLDSESSYLVAGQGGRYMLAQNVEAAGSQFFRRIIAELSGVPHLWDYRRHPHLENVALTLERASRAA